MTVEEYRKRLNAAKTAGDITKFGIDFGNSRQCFMWRQNNLAVRGRKFVGMRGLFDILGICLITGKWVTWESKTINDKPSKEQLEFQTMIRKAGGVAEFIGPDYNEFIARAEAALKKIRK